MLAASSSLAFEERLAMLVDREIAWRDTRRLERLLSSAKLKHTQACVEDVIYDGSRGLDQRLVAAVRVDEPKAITRARMQIVQYGLTHADLVAAGCFPSRKRATKQARYCSADGQTWDERASPDCLQRVVNAGQSLEHLRVEAEQHLH